MEKLIPFKDTFLTFKNYKEPLLEIPKKEGFGYYGTLLGTEDGQHIQCHTCGELFQDLTVHLRFTHRTTNQEYREKYQLNRTTSLISENMREKRKQTTLAWLESLTKEQIVEYRNKSKTALLKWRKNNPEMPWTKRLESMNKVGSCPDQVLEKIKEIKEQLGKVPTLQEFVVATGGQRYKHLIFKFYGSWNNALKLLKYKTRPSYGIGIRGKSYQKEELLEYMKLFVKENNKIPTFTDFKAGMLPDYQVYARKFGNIENARQEAGVYELINK